MSLAAVLIILGRILLGGHFLVAGIRNLLNFNHRMTLPTFRGSGIPAPVMLTGFVVQVLGGASVVLGLWPAVGAAALIAFMVAATSLYHNFLAFSGAERAQHLNFVLINCALTGGFLLVIATSL